MSYYYYDGTGNPHIDFTIDGTTAANNDSNITINDGNDEGYSQININPQIDPIPTFKMQNRSYLKLLSKLKDFYQWVKDEQHDLEQECGADLGGIIDKLEETFEELNDKGFLDIDLEMNFFRDSVYAARQNI